MDLNTYQPMILLSAVVGFSIGMMLFIIGRFGRQIDDHPLCKRCRFDLVGSIDHSSRCPECGRDVSGLRGVIIGHRKQYRSCVIISILLLLGSVSAFTVELIPMTRSMKWIRIKPTTWLIADVHGNKPVQQGASANELARRIKNRGLDHDTTRELITLALAKQADRTSPWIVAWGNILDEAIVGGALTYEEQKAYLDNMISPSLIASLSTDENDDSFLSIGYRTGSLHTGFTGLFALSGKIVRVMVDGKELSAHDPPLPGEMIGKEGSISIFGMSAATLILERRSVDISPGEHSVTVTMRTALLPVGDPKAKPVATSTIDLRGSVTVSAGDGK